MSKDSQSDRPIDGERRAFKVDVPQFGPVTASERIASVDVLLGVFSAKRLLKFYVICVIVGYGIGLPLVGYGMNQLIENTFDFAFYFRTGGVYDYIGSVFVSLGHIGVLMIICKSGILAALRRRLVAVGQMALTNCLTHTIICTTIFYGFGLGLFGRVERFGQLGFVLGIWILQLLISPIWLRHFRFGPAEWLWRTLTYR